MSTKTEPSVMTAAQWRAECVRRFGPDEMDWRFICPSCNHVASVRDWKDAGAPQNAVAFSCIGRWTGADGQATFRGKNGPCDYAGGGLIGLNPISVIDENRNRHNLFAFAEAS